MSLSKSFFNGVIWSAIEKLSVQIISFVLGIILARLLTPEEYGVVGLLIVFISFSQVFIDSGFSKALIQKQDRTRQDISTVFYFNLAIAIFCYIILWFTAPIIADFYQIQNLTALLRALSLSLIFHGFYAIPFTILSIKLNFKSLTLVTLSATLISGLIAIYLAYNKYGEWALVWQTLIKTFLMVIFIWPIVKWKPILNFSKESFKGLFKFGSKLLVSSLLENLTNNFSSLLIAKLINTKQLGFYTRGTQFADTIFSTINTVIGNVLLPGLAPLQNEKEKLTNATKKIIQITSIIIFPLFIGVALFAEPLIKILLNDTWLPVVPIMQILCIARMITVISSINVNLLYVIGRSDWVLKQQYFKIGVRVFLLAIALPFGIYYVALAELISTCIHFFINTYYPGKYMNYGSLRQLKEISSIFVITIVSSLTSLFILWQITNPFYQLLLGSLVGILSYVIMLRFFNQKIYKTALNLIVNKQR